ncbi:ARM-like helical domain-containing protein [Trypanosoma equiperdum]|uniref:ARM-like helical domain-containing protein n=1 Tax=Trypanosoma equiperdum TaxID=5694 RepID=A0A1G4IIU3_TRYEQ|nr:ARM-like helical domain-containing protein [Trypanosoma equiperdum]
MLTGDILLQEIESLGRVERYERVVEVGRAARAGGDVCKERLALIELSRSCVPYERLTAALGLWQSGCSSETLRLLKDPCGRVSRLAMLPAAEALPDADLLKVFGELPVQRLAMFCGYLERKGRVTGLVDRYVAAVTPVLQKGPGLTLLCWASVSMLAAQPTSTFYLLRKSEWGTLVRRNPNFAATLVKANINSGTEANPSAITQAHTVLAQLRRFHPSVGSQLLGCVLPRVRVSNECIEAYAKMYPVEVTQMLLKHKLEETLDVSHFFKKLDPDTLLTLFSAGVFRGKDFKECFAYAPHNLRMILYKRYRKELLDPDGSMDISMIELIPNREEREREALRALNESESLRLDPKRWVSFLSPLPLSQAVEVGKQYLKEKDVHVRAELIAAIAYGGQYHRECLDDILDFCIARGNDNDVVRRKFLMRLSMISRSKWEERHIPKLAEIVKAALDARDSSSSSLDTCMSLVLGTAHLSTKVIESSFLPLVRRVGPPFNLGKYHLPKSALLCIWSCLEPVMKKEAQSDQHMKERIMWMFSSRLRDIGDVVIPYLKGLCESEDDLVFCGISTLLKHFPTIGSQMLPNLVVKRPDVISVPEVCFKVSNSIQGELLERCLMREALEDIVCRGRFPHSALSGRYWTAAKQQMYANSTVEILLEKEEEWFEAQCLLKPLESLYSVDVAKIASVLLGEDSKPPLLRDRLIELLGRAENPESLQFLLSALNDNRSRVAIHAISKRAGALSTAQVLQIVDKAMHSKLVAVQKVAVRLGALNGDEASYNFLMQLRKGGRMNADVEAVWVQAMFNFLGKEDVWVFFHNAAQDERRAVALAVVDIPSGTLEACWQLTALCKLFVLLLNHDDAYVTVQALKKLSKSKLPSYDEELISCLFHLLDTRRQSDYFPDILLALANSSADARELAQRLVDVDLDSVLSVNAHTHCGSMASHGERFRNIVSSMVELLVEEGRQPAIVCHLICWLHPTVAGEYLMKLCEKGHLHPGCVYAIVEAAGNFGFETDGVSALEEQLRGHSNPIMQRIGLELLRRMASSAGWDGTLCEALEVYRSASDPWVRDTAKVISAEDLNESCSSY